MELNETEKEILKHLAGSGLIAMRIYGKGVKTMETACEPRSFHAGIRMLDKLETAGLVRHGDPVPYRSGKSYPILLTDLGSTEAAR